ncbi:type II secretion system protein GspG [Candidatus Sumerlaeota bacterium]|nr:type II secretion system protein GspG [Candidatus Sumerlaeota bacterium]
MKEDDKVRIVVEWDSVDLFGKIRGEKEVAVGPGGPNRPGGWNLGPNQGTLLSYSRAQNSLRMMKVGLEAYRVDNERYPPSLYRLTTPISYIPEAYPDPFAPDGAGFGYTADEKGWRIWSIGPDGKDDRGEALYDPTNGTDSAGDVTFSKE